MKNYLLILFTAFGLASCTDVLPGEDCKSGCNDAICTEIFKMITVTLTDGNGDPVLLDKYDLYFTESKKNIDKYDVNSSNPTGQYVIASDAILDDLECDGTSITFSYNLDNEQIIKEYLIGKDCCHVLQKDEQDLKIVH